MYLVCQADFAVQAFVTDRHPYFSTANILQPPLWLCRRWEPDGIDSAPRADRLQECQARADYALGQLLQGFV